MILETINTELEGMDIAYEFGTYDNPPATYFVGDLLPVGVNDEDGKRAGQIVLNGFSKVSYKELEKIDDRLYKRFRSGQKYSSEHAGLTIVYSQSQRITIADEDVNRIEIVLDYFEWKD